MEEIAEEHGDDEGLLADAKNEKDRITKASVATRIKAIKNDPEFADEREILAEYLTLAEKASAFGDKLGAAQDALTKATAAKYSQLSGDEIKALVVEDKWLATVAAAIQSELNRVSQTLTGRIRQLADRYFTPIPKVSDEVDELCARVQIHLKRMGAVWR